MHAALATTTYNGPDMTGRAVGFVRMDGALLAGITAVRIETQVAGELKAFAPMLAAGANQAGEAIRAAGVQVVEDPAAPMLRLTAQPHTQKCILLVATLTETAYLRRGSETIASPCVTWTAMHVAGEEKTNLQEDGVMLLEMFGDAWGGAQLLATNV